MRNKIRTTLCLTMSAATVVFSAGASAAPSAGDYDKCGGKNMAVANVESELLIRSGASKDAEVIGYLPSAAGVIVQCMGEEWTQVKSGDVTGYVKTDYLAFGDKAQELKSVYGVLGAVASWDDVKVFSDYEDTSSVIGSVNEGEGFEVLGSSDNWVEVLLPSGDMGYVAAEDVTVTAVLDTAVATDGEYVPAAEGGASAEDTYVEETYVENAYAEDTYTGEAYTEDYYTEDYYTEDYYTGDTYTDAIWETEAVYDDTSWNTDYTYDTTWETEYVDDTSWETEPTYDTTWETDGTYDSTTWETDGTYDSTTWETEPAYDDTTWETEAPAVEETEAPSVNASGSDLDLLAAIIYCEAGNQSMEGKIAVGQVVMNRVASGSFANTIHDVIYEAGQFTPAMTGWLDQVIGSAPQDCYDAASAALNGEGTVGGALYFNTGSGQGIKIGDHQFY